MAADTNALNAEADQPLQAGSSSRAQRRPTPSANQHAPGFEVLRTLARHLARQAVSEAMQAQAACPSKPFEQDNQA